MCRWQRPIWRATAGPGPRTKHIDLFISRWGVDYDDPDNFTHALFDSECGLLRSYYCSPESDEILRQARAETRPEVRERLYRKFDHLIVDSGVLVPLFHDVAYRVTGERVRGLRLGGTAPFVNYAELGKAETAAVPESLPSERRGALHIPVSGHLTSLDPSVCFTVEQSEVLPSVYETLTRVVEGAHVAPWLAAEFESEAAGTRFHFRLRDDVHFHDGRRLTARDVRSSFERLLRNRESDCRWRYSAIKGAAPLLHGEAADLVGLRDSLGPRVHDRARFTDVVLPRDDLAPFGGRGP